ncbi:MAG: tRNA (N6-isopentenyl adenosine(37)-C2)-methylthiotransferase MiaB [Acidobacteriota bacterium]|nr:tRNA (N6-isopentenyl adenosine(37)-C2)-methylthiotransferase MiaB [Acidobacteriota bacterium]
MKKVYLETFGCQMNVSDSERIATKLAADGFEIIKDETAADVVLLNTCSVREKAEHKIFTRVGQIRKDAPVKPLLGILGCVAQLEGETLFAKQAGIDFVLGTKAVGRVSEIIERAFDGEREIFDLGERETDYDWSVGDEQRHSPYIAFVPIIEGCNKFCTYCIVPFARGRERSLPASEIIRHVADLRRRGIREVHLIGQNVNSYRPRTESGLENFRGATAFSRLLRAVAATGIERVKFTTSFPRDFHPDIVDALDEHENLCNWVHLPVQSGSNRILKAMRRGHTIENYLERIAKIKASPRRIALTTDLIVGYPSETEADFQATLDLADYCQFNAAYYFKYSPRPGTPAFDLPDDISPAEKTERFLRLDKLIRFHQKTVFQSYVGRTLEVLAEKISPKHPAQITGHSTCQMVVNFDGSADFLGKIVKVKITESKVNTLYGKIC